MIKRLIYLLFICAGLFSVTASGQNVDRSSLEKILFYTDKPYYLSGETIYYKLIVTKGGDNSPSNLSNTVYAEFSNRAGNILRVKLLLKNGASSGAFELPDDLATGGYVLKAYTSNMKNISREIFAEKKVQVINYRQSKDTTLNVLETNEIKKEDLQVDIHADQKSYFSREKVSVDIAVKDAKAPVNLCISVYSTDTTVTEDNSIAAQVQSAYGRRPVLYRNSEPFYGTPEERYRLDDYTRFTRLEEVFREYVKGVGMGFGISNKKRLFVYDEITRSPFKQNAFVILDGHAVSDMSGLLDVDPLKIKMIDVVTRKYFYGRDVYYGIVNIESYNGDLAGYEPDNNNDSLFYETLPAQRIFEHPQYNSAALKASRHPDFRSTLYWQPDIKIDNNGKAHIEFYTSDLKGQFRLVVNAVSASGLMAGGSAIVTVQ